MDSLIALKGKDFVIIAADTTNAYSVLRMKVPLSVYRTTMIKYGISTDKNSLLLEASIPTSQFSETTYKKTSPFCNIKTATSYRLMTQLSSFDQNWPKLSEKDLTQSIAFWLDSKGISLGSTGLITLDQLLRRVKQLMDMPSI